jgi:hypothetical protein
MRRRTLLLLLALAGLLGLPSSGAASEDERLWGLLQEGGHVILIRHAIPLPG